MLNNAHVGATHHRAFLLTHSCLQTQLLCRTTDANAHMHQDIEDLHILSQDLAFTVLEFKHFH